MIEVPAAFAASTVAREGAAGEAWIAGLPRMVEELCGHWGLAPSGPPWHGYVAVVLPATRGGEDLVLKVSWIDRSSEQEALTLRAWGGRGAVHLLDAREEVGALLLERLNPQRSLNDVAVDEAAAIAGALLRRLAIPAPAELRTVREETSDFGSTLARRWEALGRPFPRVRLEQTLELIERPTRSAVPVIVNQDLHYENVLEGEREPWLVIDPKALAGDPAFGVVQLLWNRFDELAGRGDFERRLAIVCESADVDVEAARRWAVVRVVEYWIWALGEGLTDDPLRCRTLLEWLDPDMGRRTRSAPGIRS